MPGCVDLGSSTRPAACSPPARTRWASRSSLARRSSRSSDCWRRREQRASNRDAVAIAPYTAVQDQLTGESQSFSELLVQGKSSARSALAQSEVESILAAQNDTTVANLPFSVSEPGQPALDRDVELEDVHGAARVGGGGVASGRSHRRDEHHVGDGDGADP